MDRNKILNNLIENGFGYNHVNISNYLKNRYEEINLPSSLQDKIRTVMDSNLDFEITVEEMRIMLPLLDAKVEQLLKHPDFNPFKEKLREKYPKQFGSDPFTHNGVTYYLYTKGPDFFVDSYISETLGYKKLLNECIKRDKPLKYVYRKPKE